MLDKLARIFKHHGLHARDSHHAVPPAMAKRLMERVQASESRHSGEIRICVEGGLPTGYLWRGLKARHRAITLFGKLRVWDTAHNNGVLIYLLLAEQAIEIIADRGLNEHVTPQEWQAMIHRMGAAFKERRYEDGLTEAIGEVSALLVQYFPLKAGEQHSNELPDAPLLN